jgi:hypothetical protein
MGTGSIIWATAMPLFDAKKLSNYNVPPVLIERANEGVDRLRARLVNEIITSVIPDLLVRAQTRIFFQGHIRRCLMFIEGGNEAHLSGRDLVSITCARAIYETVACVFDFCEKLYDHLNEGNFEKTAQFLLVRLFAVRSKEFLDNADADEFDFTATNVLTQIDRFSKQCLGVRADYDLLSERTHPNSLGAVLHFSEEERIDENRTITRFTNVTSPHNAIRGLVKAGYLLSLMDTGIDFMQKRVDGHSFHSLKAVKSSRRR